MDCKDFNEKKLLYISGELGTEDSDGVKKHLESCSRCRLELDALKDTLGLLGELPRVSPSEERLGNIRRLARGREAGGILERLRDILTPQEVFVNRPVLVGAVALLAIVLVSLYLVHLRGPAVSLEWEDSLFEQKIAQLEEDVKFVTYEYDAGNGMGLETFEDRLNSIEEEVEQLTQEIESV